MTQTPSSDTERAPSASSSRRFAGTFKRFGIDYVVVGSFASSARGRARATAGRLDVGYLRATATELGLGELLDLAFEQSAE